LAQFPLPAPEVERFRAAAARGTVAAVSLVEERAIDFREASDGRGTLRTYRISSTVYVTRATGHMRGVHGDLFLAYAERMIGGTAAKVFVFHDWLDMTGYEASTRHRITAWATRHIDRFAAIHVALRSKLVAMGVHVANLALGGVVQVHGDLASLEEALRRVRDARPSLAPPR